VVVHTYDLGQRHGTEITRTLTSVSGAVRLITWSICASSLHRPGA
jgi:hypothetical protein